MNRYPAISELFLQAKKGQTKTIIDRVRFTAPFKVTNPFYGDGQKMEVMLLSVSAGIMAGDTQRIHIEAGNGAFLEVTTQSCEKIHRMDGGCATRDTILTIGPKAVLIYAPLPVIPFAGSSFAGETMINLADETSTVFIGDILSCGRLARNERFAYNSYRSRVKAFLSGKPIYSDNAVFEPDSMDMDSFCLYEGYSYLLNVFIAGGRFLGGSLDQINDHLGSFGGIKAGASHTGSGAVCVRALGNDAETLIGLEHALKRLIE